MDKNKNSNVYEINEYGELTIRSKEKEEKRQIPWQAHFLKAMIVLLLITVILGTILNR